MVNTLRPGQNGRHFVDDIFKCIFVNENVWIPIKISLKFVPKGLNNNIPALVQIMAWRRPGDKSLPQWVKNRNVFSCNQFSSAWSICICSCRTRMLFSGISTPFGYRKSLICLWKFAWCKFRSLLLKPYDVMASLSTHWCSALIWKSAYAI